MVTSTDGNAGIAVLVNIGITNEYSGLMVVMAITGYWTPVKEVLGYEDH